MPYVQCPYCDSFHLKHFYGNVYKCQYCGKEFHNYEKDARVPTFDL